MILYRTITFSNKENLLPSRHTIYKAAEPAPSATSFLLAG